MFLPPQEHIERLYEAFSVEVKPVRIDGCPCCLDRKEICKLVNTSLRQITPEDLGSYASSVFLTVGSEEDFRYFLPRILEILVTTSGWWPDPEVVGRAIGTVGWTSFSPAEQKAIQGFFDVTITSLIESTEVDGYNIDSWLCCASHIIPGWGQYLDSVTVRATALLALYGCHSDSLARGRLGNGFWDDSPKKQAYLSWLTSEDTKAQIQEAYGL